MAADSQSPWEGGDRLHSPPAQSAPAAPARKPIYFVLSLFSERTETGSGGRPRLLQPLPGAQGWGWKPSRGAAPPQALGAPDRQQEALLRPRTLSLWAGTKAILPSPQATPGGRLQGPQTCPVAWIHQGGTGGPSPRPPQGSELPALPMAQGSCRAAPTHPSGPLGPDRAPLARHPALPTFPFRP